MYSLKVRQGLKPAAEPPAGRDGEGTSASSPAGEGGGAGGQAQEGPSASGASAAEEEVDQASRPASLPRVQQKERAVGRAGRRAAHAQAAPPEAAPTLCR